MNDKFGRIFRGSILNYYSDDLPLQKFIRYLGIDNKNGLSDLGKYVSSELIEIMDFVDHKGKPELITWDLDGKRIDYVRLSPEHRSALRKLQELGVVRKSAGDENDWMYHYISGYVISDSGIFCTLTLTAQTAYGLKKYGDNPELKEFLEKYVNKLDPWYGATYYSETQGGSDLGANNTVAFNEGNNWYLTGNDKYFASDAGLADGAIVTAKYAEGGVKSIGLFFVPAMNGRGELNYTIRRLKNKMGTIAVPSGEVELNRSEAYLIGEKEKGIYYAMEILTVSRIDDALAASGIGRKALWEAYLHAERRSAFGKKLIEHPLMIRDLTTLEAELEGAVIISLYAARLFSDAYSSRPPYDDNYNYARFISHIAKNMAAWASDHVTQYSLEIFGGIGFFEEFPMAKFHRDALVTSIWEGTSNIQSLDMLEAIVRKNAAYMFFSKMESIKNKLKNDRAGKNIESAFNRTKEYFDSVMKSGYAECHSKDLLKKLGELCEVTLMYDLYEKEGDERDLHSADLLFAEIYRKDEVLETSLFKMDIVDWMSNERRKTAQGK
ncbi:MAG: acyl-CoA dehydrogenase family protein [Candidatus Thermoplasmatota archaeon]|jgi:acyl-CoA dehydrogenase|nr:acyl-CoA dehydrogenase family protein [Candidatus Thermoplasmatota archaeon]